MSNSTDALTVTDNRTGTSYEIPIWTTRSAPDLRQIRDQESDFGMMTYDPAFANTASCALITFLDGDRHSPLSRTSD